MLIVIVISILCLVLTYFETIQKLPYGMFIGFCCITILYCIHYDFGTDYMTYYQEFQNVVSFSYSLQDVFILDNWRNGEYGWGLLQWLCASIAGKDGFFLLVIVNSIVENVIIYKFIRKYTESQYWCFSVFVYLFTATFYLLGFSMMRQWLAMCLFLWSFDFIIEKKVVRALIIIYLASTIHHTASILMPIAFISFLPMKYTKYYGVFFLFLFVLLMLKGDFLNSTLEMLTAQSETIDNYITNYDGYDANKSFGVGFFINLIPFFLSIFYLFNTKDDTKKLLVLLSCIGTMVVPFSQSLAMVKRMSLYFTLFSIGTVPIVYSTLNNKGIRLLLVSIFVFMQFVSYWGFLNDPSYQLHYSEFKTIFSQL